MNSLKIKSYVDSSNFSRINKSVMQFCKRADKLMEKKSNVTGLLPNSFKRGKGTNLTTSQLIELVLKNT